MDSRGSLMHRYVDPATSLAEVLFGLIMTLTFTLGAGIIIDDEGREGARELLIAVIGCNIAWGVIDGALYLVEQWFNRGRLRRLGLAIRQAPDDQAAKTLVASELDELLEDVTSRIGARSRSTPALQPMCGRSPCRPVRSARPTSWEPSPASGWS